MKKPSRKLTSTIIKAIDEGFIVSFVGGISYNGRDEKESPVRIRLSRGSRRGDSSCDYCFDRILFDDSGGLDGEQIVRVEIERMMKQITALEKKNGTYIQP